MTIRGGVGDLAVLDVDRGVAIGAVQPETAAADDLVRTVFIDAMALSLLGRARGYVVVHAAAVVRHDLAIVLHGPAGAGKSTLAIACARRGFGVVAEDAVFVRPAPNGLEVWGLPWTQRLLPDAPRFFPELAGLVARPQPNGETKVQVDLDAAYPGRAVPCARPGPVLLVTRGPGSTRLEPVPAGDADLELLWPFDGGWTPDTRPPRPDCWRAAASGCTSAGRRTRRSTSSTTGWRSGPWRWRPPSAEPDGDAPPAHRGARDLARGADGRRDAMGRPGRRRLAGVAPGGDRAGPRGAPGARPGRRLGRGDACRPLRWPGCASRTSAIRRRIRRLHDDLARVLRAAAARGLEVMPLKGSLLTTTPGEDPYRRPMADLDLLVRPADRAAGAALLAELGWRHVPEHAPRPTHDTFVIGDGRVVDPVGEHEENPRRVDLHTEVKRHLWGWVDDDDLTAYLWSGATRSTVLGEAATVPTTGALFAHLAIHASSDLLVGRGRLVGWLDLGRLAARGRGRRSAASPGRLSGAAPGGPDAADGDARRGPRVAEDHAVPSALARWAESVPLDDRCGLSLGRSPDRPSSTSARWERWRPARWRLAVAYGDQPLMASRVTARWSRADSAVDEALVGLERRGGGPLQVEPLEDGGARGRAHRRCQRRVVEDRGQRVREARIVVGRDRPGPGAKVGEDADAAADHRHGRRRLPPPRPSTVTRGATARPGRSRRGIALGGRCGRAGRGRRRGGIPRRAASASSPGRRRPSPTSSRRRSGRPGIGARRARSSRAGSFTGSRLPTKRIGPGVVPAGRSANPARTRPGRRRAGADPPAGRVAQALNAATRRSTAR